MVNRDFQGRQIRLPAERWAHIITTHPYMVEMPDSIAETLESPEVVMNSTSDPASVKLNYRRFTGTVVGDKWVCVIVKYTENDAYILTAYVTDAIKEGG